MLASATHFAITASSTSEITVFTVRDLAGLLVLVDYARGGQRLFLLSLLVGVHVFESIVILLFRHARNLNFLYMSSKSFVIISE